MVATDPTWINGIDYDGAELRRIQTLSAMTNGTALGARGGVIPGTGGLGVSLGGSTITVGSGNAWVYQAGQGLYGVSLNSGGSHTLTAAHATLPRIDLVYLRVWDNAVDASGLNKADSVYLAGTASASPSAPTPAGTQIYLPLATISVPASGGGSPSVNNTVAKTVAPGGILPDPAATGYYAGQVRDNGTYLERYSGSVWAPIGPSLGTADWENDLKIGTSRKLVIGTDCNLYRSAANVLKTDDDLIIKTHRAKGSESGTKTFSFTAQTSSTTTVTFATTFAAAPRVFCNINSTAGSTLQWTAKAASITTTGCTMIVSGPSATWASVDVDWMAVMA